MSEYYIVTEASKHGPFDAMAMVRKIKNGKLKPHDRVQEAGKMEPVAANQIKLFHDYFLDLEYRADSPLDDVSAHDEEPSAVMVLLEALIEKLPEHKRERPMRWLNNASSAYDRLLARFR